MNILNHNTPIIIGIDHGYGNIKTANCCFKTGVASFDKEPTFKSNLLVYEGRYYLIGEEHKEFTADKMADSDYYILTAFRQGHIQLADRETPSSPFSIGAHTKFVNASAIAKREPAPASAIAATGA